MSGSSSGPTSDQVPPGRRVGERRSRRPEIGAVVGTVLVLLTVATAYLTGQSGGRPDPEPRATNAPVEEVTSVCLAGAGAGEVLTYAAPVEGAEEGGTLEVTAVDGTEQERLEPTPGEPVRVEVGRRDDLVVTARDAAAVGRVTSRTDRSAATLAHQPCAEPRARWWFTGAGVDPAHGSRVVLANVDSGPAVVDVTVYGPHGPLETVDTRGVVVRPDSRQVIELADVAAQADEVSFRVETSRGRVVAAASDDFTLADGTTGREWLPAQQEVSRRVRLAPLPRRAGTRTLLVANPSDREALVQVEVSGRAGSFVPTEGAELRVPPGATASADLTEAIGREPSAVTLRSTTRLAATIRSAGDGDVTYAPVSSVLPGPAAATVPGDGRRTALHLSAGDDGVRAGVTAYDSDGEEVAADVLEVQPGATLRWAPGRGAAYVVVTPEDGWVYGGLVTTGAGGLTQAVLRTVPQDLRRPPVAPAER